MSYLAISFAPVQGFIEKSRKLRDLYGASLILSHLTFKIVEAAEAANCIVISPGSPNVQLGMPNRILLQGNWDGDAIRAAFIQGWSVVLSHCREWIVNQLSHYTYEWDEEWGYWKNHTWEIFFGTGDSVELAMFALEQKKLSRAWIAPNWIGESSSLTGTDAIAWPKLGSPELNPRTYPDAGDRDKIKYFYYQLACKLEGKEPKSSTPTKQEMEEFLHGFLDPNEHLSIPELVKRLVTKEEIAKRIGMISLVELAQKSGKSKKKAGFTEIVRRPRSKENGQKGHEGQWTGWFMGDGDKMGDCLKLLSKHPNCDTLLFQFSEAMRNWGKIFQENFPHALGRVVYAGGDDFLGVLYHPNFAKNPQDNQINGVEALKKLQEINQSWQTLHEKLWEDLGKVYEKPITLSVGLVWAAPGVPQRDVLQHCREAEKLAKSSGRDRLTMRVLFNSGQYVQWTCPWSELSILENYQDREKGNNWGHVYNDLAQLKARRAIDLSIHQKSNHSSLKAFDQTEIALSLLKIYFGRSPEEMNEYETRKRLVGNASEIALVQWINDLISVGWQLLRERETTRSP